MMKKLNKKDVHAIISSAFLTFCLIMTAIELFYYRTGEQRYTIGWTTQTKYFNKSTKVFYKYYVNGVKYETYTSLGCNPKVPNGRYYVKFYVEHPDRSEINFKESIPLSIQDKDIPSEGWKHKPPTHQRICW